MLRVWVPHVLEPGWLVGLPPRVEVETFAPEQGSFDAAEVEFFAVPWWRNEEVRAVLPKMPALRVIQTLTAGVEPLLVHVPAGVTLCDGSGIHDASVSEWVVGVMLAVLRRLPEAFDAQRAGTWQRIKGDDLAGKTVLIVGAGSIGRALEERLRPFEVKFLRVARTARPGVSSVNELDRLLPEADVVVLLLPLTEGTRGLLSDARIRLMKPGALLVNAARGAIVDGDALVLALSEKRIFAALDVTSPEPLPEGHALWKAPNLLLTPHVAGSTPAFLPRAYRFLGEQIARYAEGKPLENVVRDGY